MRKIFSLSGLMVNVSARVLTKLQGSGNVCGQKEDGNECHTRFYTLLFLL
jgi:hypothetical protein